MLRATAVLTVALLSLPLGGAAIAGAQTPEPDALWKAYPLDGPATQAGPNDTRGSLAVPSATVAKSANPGAREATSETDGGISLPLVLGLAAVAGVLVMLFGARMRHNRNGRGTLHA